MPYRFLYSVIVGLIVMLGLAWLAWMLPDMGMRWEEPLPKPSPIPHIGDEHMEDSPDGTLSGDALARPPFWASRRPLSEEAAAPIEEQNDIDGAVVVGLLRREGLPVVIIRQADGKAGRVAAGQEIGGGKLTAIEDDVAIFEHANGKKQSLRITRRRVEDLPQRSTDPQAAPQNVAPPQGQQPSPQAPPPQTQRQPAPPQQRVMPPQQRLPQRQ